MALQAEARAHGRGRDAVLAGAGLGDDPPLAEPLGEQRLADGVVDLVRAGVGQVLALEPDARARRPRRQALGQVERRRPADVVARQALDARRRRPDRRRPPRTAASSSSSAAMTVSGTKRPPKAPKRPRSSGECGHGGLLGGGDERADAVVVLDAGRGLDAARGVDGQGWATAHRRGDVLGIEASGEQHRPIQPGRPLPVPVQRLGVGPGAVGKVEQHRDIPRQPLRRLAARAPTMVSRKSAGSVVGLDEVEPSKRGLAPPAAGPAPRRRQQSSLAPGRGRRAPGRGRARRSAACPGRGRSR